MKQIYNFLTVTFLITFGMFFLSGAAFTGTESTEQPQLTPAGVYVFELHSHLTPPQIEDLKTGRSGIKLYKMIDSTHFVGEISGAALPGYIKASRAIPPVEKHLLDLDNIALDQLLTFEDLNSPETRCEIDIGYLDESDHTRELQTIGLTNVQSYVPKVYHATLVGCSPGKIKSVVSSLALNDLVEFIAPAANALPAIHDISVRLGAYYVHAGRTPYGTSLTGKGRHIMHIDLGAPVEHVDYWNRLAWSQCNSISCPIFAEYNRHHPTRTLGVLIGDGTSGQLNNLPRYYHKGILPDAIAYSFDIIYAASEMMWMDENYDIDVATNSWHFVPISPITGSRDSLQWHTRVYNMAAEKMEDTPAVFAAGNTRCEINPERKSLCDFYKGYGAVCDPYAYYGPVPDHAKIACLWAPSGSKNTLTVGSIDMDGNPSDFTAFGPTYDGRVKPDVVSLGEEVQTTDGIKPSNSTYYTQYTNGGSEGTSYATPGVAGLVSYLREFLDERNARQEGAATEGYESPLIKAALIHTARDITDITPNNQHVGPDIATGWGEPQIQEAFKILEHRGGVDSFILGSFDQYNKHQTKMYPIQLPEWEKITKPIKLTMVWLDYYDHEPIGGKDPEKVRELVNNLDLSLCDARGSVIEYPYVLDWQDPGKPAAKGFNDRDNVEQVVATPERIKQIVLAGTKTVYACVTFANHFQSPYVDQKFVLLIGDGSRGDNSFTLTCGNQRFEPGLGEQCDVGPLGTVDFGGKTCQSLGRTNPIRGGNIILGGKLRCDDQCQIDDKLCGVPYSCGNGTIDSYEMCDPGAPLPPGMIGCYGPEDGEAKACRAMCNEDVECPPGIWWTQASCIEGVCVEASSRGGGGNGGGVPYTCRGVRVNYKPDCPTGAGCAAGEYCDAGCRCQKGYMCQGAIVQKKPECGMPNTPGCQAGEQCVGCQCVLNPVHSCRGRNIAPLKFQCLSEWQCPQKPGKKAHCNADCQCFYNDLITYECVDNRTEPPIVNIINHPPECSPGETCSDETGSLGVCSNLCECIVTEETDPH